MHTLNVRTCPRSVCNLACTVHRGRCCSSRCLRHFRSSATCNAGNQREQLVTVNPAVPTTGEKAPCWVAPASILVLSAVVTCFMLGKRRQKAAHDPLQTFFQGRVQEPVLRDDCRQYQRALARSRQSTHIAAAVSLNKRGEYVKAHQELLKALGENSVCRSPSLDGVHTKDEYVELYKLHIRLCEGPPSFATLLQLQEMMGLSQEEAERIELQVLNNSGAFSI